MSELPDMRAHRLATEIATRVRDQRSLGRPSIYNIAREVLADEFADEHVEPRRYACKNHLSELPEAGEDHRPTARRARLTGGGHGDDQTQ